MIEEKARNAKARKTLLNPNGVYLPFAECNRICMRHREEADVIPKGREEGWPSEGDIDWKKLEQ